MLFFLDIKLILMIQSQLSLFVSRDEEMKCLWFYFDREWKGFFVVILSPGLSASPFSIVFYEA